MLVCCILSGCRQHGTSPRHLEVPYVTIPISEFLFSVLGDSGLFFDLWADLRVCGIGPRFHVIRGILV